MLHVASLSQDSLAETPDTKRFANRSKTSFYPISQNLLSIIGLTEETRSLPTLDKICHQMFGICTVYQDVL